MIENCELICKLLDHPHGPIDAEVLVKPFSKLRLALITLTDQNNRKLDDLVRISRRIPLLAGRFEVDDEEEFDVLDVVAFEKT